MAPASRLSARLPEEEAAMKGALRFACRQRKAAVAAAAVAVLLVALAGPVAAANTNLTATAHYAASSEWESDRGNTTFIAAKAFDGDVATRWNVAGGNDQNSWIAANWSRSVTINRVVVHEAFDRLDGFRIQRYDTARVRWVDAYVAEGQSYAAVRSGDPANPTFSIRLTPSVHTDGLRVLFTKARSSPSIFEVEAYNNPAGTLTGSPVAGATVRAGTDSTTTGADGRYTLVSDAGRVDVTAGKPGAFRGRVARGVELPPDGAAARDFVLLPQPANLAWGAVAVSSSDWENGPDYDAAKATDGRLDTRWNSHASEANLATLELQWPEPQTFNQVTVRQAFDRIRNYSLMRYDEQNDLYVPFLNADVPRLREDPVLTHVLPTPVTTRRLRLMVNVTDAVPSIYELEVAMTPVAAVRGRVVAGVSGQPVRRAAIQDETGVLLGAANDQGEFHLLVAPGDYLFTAAAEGYLGASREVVTVEEGQTAEVTLTAAALGANIAGAAKARASSAAAGGESGAERVNDGDPGTAWVARSFANQWVALTWERPVQFTAVQLRGFRGTIQRSYLEVLAADGATWVELPGTSFSPQFLGSRPADFLFPQGVTTTGLRYFITATHSMDDIPGLAEIRVFDPSLPAQ
jgi:hypothetical protein